MQQRVNQRSTYLTRIRRRLLRIATEVWNVKDYLDEPDLKRIEKSRHELFSLLSDIIMTTQRLQVTLSEVDYFLNVPYTISDKDINDFLNEPDEHVTFISDDHDWNSVNRYRALLLHVTVTKLKAARYAVFLATLRGLQPYLNTVTALLSALLYDMLELEDSRTHAIPSPKFYDKQAVTNNNSLIREHSIILDKRMDDDDYLIIYKGND